jgi:hypothetical protein
MSGVVSFCLGVVLATATAVASAETPRIISRVLPGTSTVVVVAEGDFEPRSLGSYSVRTYAGANPRFPHDDFIAGSIRPRDGAVANVLFADVDRDGAPEIVVVLRSAGTGGYLSADAFRLQGTILLLVESVSGLAKDANPIRALEAKFTGHAEPRAAPEADKSRR